MKKISRAELCKLGREFFAKSSRVLATGKFYWMDSEGTSYSVPFMTHEDGAVAFLEKYKILTKKDRDDDLPATFILYKKGWLRLAIDNWRLEISTDNPRQPSKKQQKVLDDWVAESELRSWSVW